MPSGRHLSSAIYLIGMSFWSFSNSVAAKVRMFACKSINLGIISLPGRTTVGA